MEDDALAILGLVLCLKRKKPQRYWVKDWLLKRKQYSHVNLIKELKFAPKDWHNYLRMDEELRCMDLHLLSLVTPHIKRRDTVMREAITPHERLTVTLRFLATGRSYEDLKYSTIISPQALSYIIPETCDALYEILRHEYFKFPRTEDQWRTIAKEFESRWNFPHCLGALDGKHVEIIPPKNSGSFFYNYKGRFSMILLAISDARYRLIFCNFGTNGRISDGGVLENTKFFEKLNKKLLSIPPREKLNKSSRTLPYVFVADDAFPLRMDMMKPFRQSDVVSENIKIYNYRTSRARRIIENVFGILAARFRMYRTKIALQPKTIESVVMASCALHNYLMSHLPTYYVPAESFDVENVQEGTMTLGLTTTDSRMEPLQQSHSSLAPKTAKDVRDDFITYFVNEGQVPWQNNFIH